MDTTSITVKANISAPISTVWECWANPEHITKWNFATPDWHCPKAENDLRVGGKYFARMEAKDGSFAFDFEAVYDEVIAHKRLAYTIGDGRKVKTSFDSHNGATMVTTVFDAEMQNGVELQRAGWQAILDNFKQYTEAIDQEER